MKILLCDDSDTIRMILKGLLEELELTDVVESKNGEDALAQIEDNDFDLVLIDIHMPKMDGLTFLEEIRTRPQTKYVPIIFISSDTDPRRLEKAKKLGAFGFIRKPFRVLGLRRAIEEATKEITRKKQQESNKKVTKTSASSNEPQPVKSEKGVFGWLRRMMQGK